MTLAAPLAALETRLHGLTADAQADLRGVLDHFSEVRASITEHVGALMASPVLAAFEATALSPQGEALVAELIRQLGQPRPELSAGAQIPDGAESHGEPSGAASDTPIGDQAAAVLSAGPSVGGMAR